jgi:lipopolysaccharide/colanic/teichoic acid biosynthesis glycosyltransferase
MAPPGDAWRQPILESRANSWSWRAIDLIVSVAGLVVTAPIVVVVSIVLKSTSPGPLLFRQQRVGRQGQLFTIFKFRTMQIGSADRFGVTTAQDKRITPIGRFLRTYKLDELPQLVNVLFGQMSVVGPRPDVEAIWELLPDDCHRALAVRPGITCSTTLLFDHETELMQGHATPDKFYSDVVAPAKMRSAAMEFSSITLPGYFIAVIRTIKRDPRNTVEALERLLTDTQTRAVDV